MAVDIFSDRRAVQDRRRDGTTLSQIELCRRQDIRSRRGAGAFNRSWWLSTDYVETETRIQKGGLLRASPPEA